MPDRAGALRILHVEDEPNDRELVSATLRAAGLDGEIVCVDTKDAFLAALERSPFDVILADDRLPTFDGRTAQQLAAERAPNVPFIFVSGTLGEEIAIERLKDGATDYVLKQRLSRLAASITRAIIEARTRTERESAEAEIRRLNAELEARVAARTAELAGANHALAERQEALRESEQRLQGILDHSPAIIYLKDIEGRFILVNHQFERSFRMTRAEVLGRSASDLYPPRLAEMYVRNDQQALASESLYVEEPALIDGEVHVFSTAKFPLIGADGQPYALCGISSDITERKKADDQVKAARLEAERANRAKSEFLSRMSHDLRTPLNAVLGFAQLLESENLLDAQHECVQQILRGGQHLLDLINEVLDIARIEAGRLSLSPEPVAIRETVKHAIALVAPLAAKRSVTLVFDESEHTARSVVADRQRLNQILLNLLSNAVKYNRPGGRVTVSIEASTPGRIRLKVSDTGAGIPRGKLQLLFKPFERLGAESTAVEGTGLGLALSRGLAEAMGGALGVVSEVDRGSTFWVELDASDEGDALEQAVVSDRAAMKPAPRAATVLYIEDNSSNVRLMERVLGRRPGVTLVHAGQGQTGVALATDCKPDIIFLDMHLPDVPGEEVLRLLWNDPELRRVPVVVLSADATPGQVRRVLASGASAYLTKPLDLQKVLDTLDGILSSPRPSGAAGIPDGIVT
jgi:PAS domain S-box-containing protein